MTGPLIPLKFTEMLPLTPAEMVAVGGAMSAAAAIMVLVRNDQRDKEARRLHQERQDEIALELARNPPPPPTYILPSGQTGTALLDPSMMKYPIDPAVQNRANAEFDRKVDTDTKDKIIEFFKENPQVATALIAALGPPLLVFVAWLFPVPPPPA